MPPSKKPGMGKKMFFGWIFISVIAALLMVFGVLTLEMRNPQIESVDKEITVPTEPLAEYVYLIIVDGLRVDAMDEMPYVSDLASRGGFGIMEVEMPTYSRPAYARLITGASSSINGMNGNFQARRLTIPTIYDIAVDNGLRTGASAYYWFYEIAVDIPYRTGSDYENRIVNDINLPIQFGYYYDDFGYVYDDEEIFAQGKRIMLEHSPNLLIIHSMEVDQLGHDYGGISDEYRDASRRNDLYIRDFVEAIPYPEESVIIITGDHGHIDRGGHGGPEKEAVEVPLLIAGKNVLNKEADGYTQLDIAPTLTALLGLPFSAYMEGVVMDAPFNWPSGVKEQKDSLLAEVHRPFVTSMYDRYDISYTEGKEISISRLHEIVHNQVVKSNLIISLVITGVLLIIILLGLRFYSGRNRRESFRGKELTLISAVASTIVFFIVYYLIFRLLHLDYSYSIIEPNAGFIIRLSLPPIIAFVFFFLSFTKWMSGKRDFESYALHTIALFLIFLVAIVAAIIYQGGDAVFLPDLGWYLFNAFTTYHLLITGVMCLICNRFVAKSSPFDLEEKLASVAKSPAP